MNIQKKRVIITGGTAGIGYELTRFLHSENEVIVISRSVDKLRKLVIDFEGVITYQADLSKLDEVDTVADTITKRFEHIYILINNAAVQYTPNFLDDEFRHENIAYEISLNFTSVCSVIYQLLTILLHKNKAIILNINSALSLTPKTSSAIYCATKGALIFFPDY